MRIGDKPTNPGELRVAITLQKRGTSMDAGGFISASGVQSIAVYARWQNAHGGEAWTAAFNGATEPATVLIRYQAELDATWRVLKGTHLYEIVSIDDIYERHEYQELKVKRVEAG